MRRVFLAGAESAWLRGRAMRAPFVRRSVSRFMPGETMDDALEAARQIEAQQGTGALLTHLGENLSSLAEAEAVTGHYLRLIDRVREGRLDSQVSVKLTQLGLDLGAAECLENVRRLVEHAERAGSMVWIDMESSPYVDPTLDIFRRLRERTPRVGVCLQAYLRRTPSDLDTLLPVGAAIRLVKGAYREPPAVAFPKKADVDEQYFRLARRLLDPSLPQGTFLGIATHDERLIERLRTTAAAGGADPARYEHEMLYGIQRPLQAKLTHEGERLRILISYGEYWFPWFMRRLAERPANAFFVARNLLRG
ncbi:MAG TPA: proline dehydrogenase family protein [Vicinamibacterales bacterium]|jgi:proline dehydrogenase|nr:proline dehydrogenase family protein [Vicinamibacterales bacterium]